MIARATQHLFTRPIVDKLPAVRAPALLICEDKDTVVPATIAEGVKARVGGPVTGPVLLKGGHVPMWDDPEAFNRTVLKFASGVGGGPQRAGAPSNVPS